MRLRPALILPGLMLLATVASAMAAPPAPAPDVIVPAALPLLQAIRSDSVAVPATQASIAPMPDADAAAPTATPDEQPEIRPAVYANKTQFRGDGFSIGSTAQAVQERSEKPATGLALNVPLD